MAVGLLFVVAGVAAGGTWAFNRYFKAPVPDMPLWTVRYEKLQLTIVERGSLESAFNNEIVCRVKAGQKGSTLATTIRWVIDEGTNVKKGQKVIEFDDSGLEKELKAHLIVLEQSRAAAVTAKTNMETLLNQLDGDEESWNDKVQSAKADILKYIEGDYPQSLKDIQGRLKVSRSDLQMQRVKAAYADRQVKKGYMSRSQAEAEQARLESNEISVRKIEDELNVLENHSKPRTLRDLQSKLSDAKRNLQQSISVGLGKIGSAAAELEAKLSILEKDEDRRREIEDEIRKCVLYAPNDGVVVYFMPEQNRFGGGKQTIIAQNEPVSEGQKLMRIPDLGHMLVNARVHEALVGRVRGDELEPTLYTETLRLGYLSAPNPLSRAFLIGAFHATYDTNRDDWKPMEFRVKKAGQRALIRVDALPNRVFKGHVKTVATVASSADFFSSDIKVYTTLVAIDEDVSAFNLKPNMSAEVTIFAEEAVKAELTVPIQAVVGSISMGQARKVFVVDAEGQPQERDVVVGKSNEKMVEVLKGLSEGEKVVLNPRPLLKGENAKLKAGVPSGRPGDAPGGGGDKKKGGGPAAPGGAGKPKGKDAQSRLGEDLLPPALRLRLVQANDLPACPQLLLPSRRYSLG